MVELNRDRRGRAQAAVAVVPVAVPPGMEVVAQLGHGDFGDVYHVRRAGSDYAVKVLRARDDGGLLRAARREAALLTCIDSPGLSRIHEVGEVDGRPYLAMDLIAGRTLAEVLRDGPLAPSRVAALGHGLALTLAAAHRAGVVHRDVKPENILITPQGQAVVIDFGLAVRGSAAAGQPRRGTLAYCAPEQSGMLNRPVDGRSDLYSLGAVLFEAATGAPPFTAEDAGALMRQHLLAPAPDPALARPELPGRLCRVILRLLAKDPESRYPTGTHVATALASLVGAEARRPDADRPALQPLVGRREEWAALDGAWRRARAGHGEVVLVHGPSGIGRGHLIRHLLDTLDAGGSLVLAARCRADERPLSPWSAALEGWARSLRARDQGRGRAISSAAAVASTAAWLLELAPTLAELLSVEAPQVPPAMLPADVAAFLVGTARAAGGLVIHLDRAEAVDSASAAVLRHLTEALPTTPLLVLLTVSEAEPRGPYRDLVARLEPAAGLHVGALTEVETAQLVVRRLAGAAVPPEVAARLSAPGAGHPGATLAYVDAVIEAGLLYPSWGRWVLDEAGLAALSLPTGLRELTARRLAELTPSVRDVLTAAAVLGTPFDPGRVAQISGLGHAVVLQALSDAGSLRLVEASPAGGTAFSHAAVADALLATTPPERLRRLHRRTAAARAEGLDLAGLYEAAAAHVMSRRGPTPVVLRGRRVPSGQVYAVAHHLLRSDPGPGDRDAFLAARAAGILALAENAPFEAVSFLDRMHQFARGGGGEVDGVLRELTAIASLRHGRLLHAQDQFTRALAEEADPWSRVRLHLRLAQVALARMDSTRCLEAVRAGIEDSGRTPSGSGRLVLRPRLRGQLLRLLGQRARAEGEALTGQRYLAMLYCVGISLSQVRPLEARRLSDHALDLAVKVRGAPEVAVLDAGREIVAAGLGSRRERARIARRLSCARLDSYGAATVAVRRALAAVVADEDDRLDGISAALEEHGHRIHIGDLLLTATTLLAELELRGRSRDALAQHERIWDRAGLRGSEDEHPFVPLAAAARAALGDRSGATEDLRRLRRAGLGQPDAGLVHLRLLAARLHACLELGDLGEEFEAAAGELTQAFPEGRGLPTAHSDSWVWYTAGRLVQCLRAGAARRPEQLRQATEAVTVLGSLARTRILRAHHGVALAWSAHLAGDDAVALDRAAAAAAHAHLLDAPIIAFEVARLQAVCLRRLGDRASSRRAAAAARAIADQEGWHARARELQQEFAVARLAGEGTLAPSGAPDGLDGRRLQALQQVSLASAAVLEPRELARIALDETMRILGAERAMLFLCEDDAGRASPGAGTFTAYLGRQAGQDLAHLSDYSSTLVRRVALEQRPLVVTGSDEGAALGSRSAVLHDLRSILVAPLHLQERLIGVVYLDSRVASGIFTDDDVDMLLAITHHIAISLRTARAARLAADVQVARRQRDMAELLRSSLVRVSAVQDPADILQDTLATAATLLGAQAYLLLRGDDDPRTVVAGQVDGVLAPGEEVRLAGGGPIGSAARPTVLRGTPHTGLPEGEWVVLPLLAGSTDLGAILAGRPGREFGEAEIELAGALVGQNLAAYRNAELLRRLHHLAAVDELTGLSTRRHFFELSAAWFASARREGTPVTAMMIDVDHFKQVNDGYGHAVGDEVLLAVARALRRACPGGGLIGRYGGEEFAVVIGGSPADTRASAEAMRAQVAGAPIPTSAGGVAVTVSIGVARSDDPADPADHGPAAPDVPADAVEALLARADQALYRAKLAGRNRVVLAGDGDENPPRGPVSR